MKNHDEFQQMKIRALYGKRSSLKLDESVLTARKKSIKNSRSDSMKKEKDEETDEPVPFYRQLII